MKPMNVNNFQANLSLVLAHSLRFEQTEAFEREFPGSSGFKAFAIGGGSSKTKSAEAFERTGTTANTRTTELPDFLKSIISSNASTATISPEMSTAQNNFLSGLMTRDNSNVIGKEAINSNINLNPTSFEGRTSLVNTANRDPFSSDYEDETADKFTDTVKQAIANVSTGPDSVRGGQARVGIRQGEALERASLDRTAEVRAAQAQDSSMGQAASQILAAIESGRRAVISGSQNQYMQQFLGGTQQGVDAAREVDAQRGIHSSSTALAGRLLGTDRGTTTEDLQGMGTQTGSGSQLNWNLLGGCCFIFLEGLNGELPWYVRRGRDLFVTPQRRAGYVRMSRWLVPLMAKNPKVKTFVNFVLIKPFLKVGAWFFGEENAKPYWRVLRPYCEAWFKVWDFLGRGQKNETEK